MATVLETILFVFIPLPSCPSFSLNENTLRLTLLFLGTVTFAKLVGHPTPQEAEVSILDIGEWDVQGQYKEIVDATRAVTKGSDVRVYRIGRGGSRIEYWVVGVEGGKLLGARALAIES